MMLRTGNAEGSFIQLTDCKQLKRHCIVVGVYTLGYILRGQILQTVGV